MELPFELKLQILRHLEKQDQKAVRLVNRKWCASTNGFLFDRIYWSSQDRDLEVYEEYDYWDC